jgi:hypothetical protein
MSDTKNMSEEEAVTADLAWLDRQHPAWHAWRSNAGKWYASRLGCTLTDSAIEAGAAMTVAGQDDPQQIHDLLCKQERIAERLAVIRAAGGPE